MENIKFGPRLYYTAITLLLHYFYTTFDKTKKHGVRGGHWVVHVPIHWDVEQQACVGCTFSNYDDWTSSWDTIDFDASYPNVLAPSSEAGGVRTDYPLAY